MNDLLTSASKLSFLLVTLTVCAGFLLKILPVAEFMVLASAAFTYYFSHKQQGSPGSGEPTK